jgi:hypothetical protein
VGQESNLHPAVLEHAAQSPDSSKLVQIAREFAVSGDASSRGVQERLASM